MFIVYSFYFCKICSDILTVIFYFNNLSLLSFFLVTQVKGLSFCWSFQKTSFWFHWCFSLLFSISLFSHSNFYYFFLLFTLSFISSSFSNFTRINSMRSKPRHTDFQVFNYEMCGYGSHWYFSALFSSTFWTPIKRVLSFWMVFQRFLRLCSFYFLFFFSVFLRVDFSIYESWLILSVSHSDLLLSSSIAFFISVIAPCNSRLWKKYFCL